MPSAHRDALTPVDHHHRHRHGRPTDRIAPLSGVALEHCRARRRAPRVIVAEERVRILLRILDAVRLGALEYEFADLARERPAPSHASGCGAVTRAASKRSSRPWNAGSTRVPAGAHGATRPRSMRHASSGYQVSAPAGDAAASPTPSAMASSHEPLIFILSSRGAGRRAGRWCDR
jgi:hypothetical protein